MSCQFTLTVKWIPRECLTFADSLSKSFDYDDWKTTVYGVPFRLTGLPIIITPN